MQAPLQSRSEEKEHDTVERVTTHEAGAASGLPMFLGARIQTKTSSSAAPNGGKNNGRSHASASTVGARSPSLSKSGGISRGDVSRALGGGRPLDKSTRALFEPRFGRDFSDVLIHTGPSAADATRAMGAVAFTVGKDIAFDHGQFAPGVLTGQSLLAHELAHVVQQSGTAGSRQGRGFDYDHSEGEADRAAHQALVHGHVDTLSEIGLAIQRQPAPGAPKTIRDDAELDIYVGFRGYILPLQIMLSGEVRPSFDADASLQDNLAAYINGLFNTPDGPAPETARFAGGARLIALIEQDLTAFINNGTLPTLSALLAARAEMLRKQRVRNALEDWLNVGRGTVDWATLIPNLRVDFAGMVDTTTGADAKLDSAYMFLNILENEIAGSPPVVGGVVPASADVFQYALSEVRYTDDFSKLFSEKFLAGYLDLISGLKFVPEGLDITRFKPSSVDIAETRRNELIDRFIDLEADGLTTKFLLDRWTRSGVDPEGYLANIDVDKEKDAIVNNLTDEFMKRAKTDRELASSIRETARDKARYDLLVAVFLIGQTNDKYNRALPSILDKNEVDLDKDEIAIVHDPVSYYETSFYLAYAINEILSDVTAGANIAQSTIVHASQVAGKAQIPKNFGMFAALVGVGMAIGELQKAVNNETQKARDRIADRINLSWKDIAKVIHDRGVEADKFINETFIPELKKLAIKRITDNRDELQRWKDNFGGETNNVIERYRLSGVILQQVADKLQSGEEKSATVNGQTVTKEDVPKILNAVAYVNAKADKLDSFLGKIDKWFELQKALNAFDDVKVGIESGKYKPNHFGRELFEEVRAQLGIGEFEYGTTVGDVVMRRTAVKDNPFEAWAIERWTFFELVYEQQEQLKTFAIIGVLAISTFLLPGIATAFMAVLDVGAGVASAVSTGVAVAATGVDIGFNVHQAWKGYKGAQATLELARLDTDLSIQGVTVEQAQEALDDAFINLVITLVLAGVVVGVLGFGLYSGIQKLRFPQIANLAETNPGLARQILQKCGETKLANKLLENFAGDAAALWESLAYVDDAKKLATVVDKVKDADLARRLLIAAGHEKDLTPLLSRYKNYAALDEMLGAASAEQLLNLYDLAKSETSVAKLLEVMDAGRADKLLRSGLSTSEALTLNAAGDNAVSNYLSLAESGDAATKEDIIRVLRRGAKDADVIDTTLQKSADFMAANAGTTEVNVVQRFAKVADAEKELDAARKELEALEKEKKPTAYAQDRVNKAAKSLTEAREKSPAGLGHIFDWTAEEFAVNEKAQHELFEQAQGVRTRQQAVADGVTSRLGITNAEAKSMLKRETFQEFRDGVIGKLKRKGYKSVNEMEDIVRGRFNLDTPQQVEQVVGELQNEPTFAGKIPDFEDPITFPQKRQGVEGGYPRTHVIMKDPETGIAHEWQVGTKATTRAFESGEGIKPIDLHGVTLKEGMHANIHDIEYDIFKTMQESNDVETAQLARDLKIPEFRRAVAELAAETGEKGNLTPNLDARISALHEEAGRIMKGLVDRKGTVFVEHFFH